MQELSAILEFLQQNPKVLLLLSGWYVFSAIVGALPAPEEVKNAVGGRPVALLAYSAAYKALHIMAANPARVFQSFRLNLNGDADAKP